MPLNTKAVVACAAIVLLLLVTVGCVGRTGKSGKPIAETYQGQIVKLKVGESTPQDLKAAFSGASVSLKELKVQDGNSVETWEVFRGGNMDVGAFILWGQIAHDKDQSLLFHFTQGKLTGYETVVHEDPPSK